MQIKAFDLAEAWMKVMGRFQEGKGVVTNKFRGDIFLNLFDILILTETQYTTPMTGPGLYLEDVGYTPSKVGHLLRTYIDPAELTKWVRQIRETEAKYGQVDSDVLLPTIRESRHTNGPCLLGFSYRSRGEKTLTVYSRSADFPQVAVADAMLIDALGELVAGGPCRVRWYIAGARLRSRVANFYTAWCCINDQPKPLFADAAFQAHIEAGWRKFVVEGREVSFRKLEALQRLGRQALGVTPRSTAQTGSTEFLTALKKSMTGGGVAHD